MAKDAKAPLEQAQSNLGTARLKKLIIKNFRCIGSTPVEIDLDDIVVLVGPNNAGKSTILRAYEVVMNHGSTEGRLTISDFPREIVDTDNYPEIELQTYIDPDTPDKPGDQWQHTDPETNKKFVRERWLWTSPNTEPERKGRQANAEDWSDGVPWGAPNVAKVNRPIPHRVDAFASPEEQAKDVVAIIKTVLQDQAKKIVGDGEDAASALDKLRTQIIGVQAELIESSKAEIEKIEQELSALLSEVFIGFKVTIDPRHQDVSDKAFSLFAIEPELRMGPVDGHSAPIEKQGSGARRTLLWSALRLVGERSGVKKPAAKGRPKTVKADASEPADTAPEPSRPHVLLLDEPEICLHPTAIREACRVLYGLAEKSKGWQVMVTTHSPVFIDLSRDNTTIVRVERDEAGSIRGSTVFRPDRVKLTDDDKAYLKLLNLWDPYVAEFFFGGRSIIVEGDTEYSAFQFVIDKERQEFGDVHVIRARGKFIIPSLMKILNHFGAGYAVLHDSDKPALTNGNANPAWAGNEAIISTAKVASDPGKVRVVASLPNFEEAFLGTSSTTEKPYKAISQLQKDDTSYKNVKALLAGLLDQTQPLPTGAIAWSDITALSAALPAKGD